MLFQIVGYLITYLIMTFIFVAPVLYAIKTSDGHMARLFESFKYTSKLRQRLFGGKKVLFKQSMLYGILPTLLIFVLSWIGSSDRFITVIIGGATMYFFTKWVTKKSIELHETQM